MVPETKTAKMFNKFDRNPNGYELSGNRNELKKEPGFL